MVSVCAVQNLGCGKIHMAWPANHLLIILIFDAHHGAAMQHATFTRHTCPNASHTIGAATQHALRNTRSPLTVGAGLVEVLGQLPAALRMEPEPVQHRQPAGVGPGETHTHTHTQEGKMCRTVGCHDVQFV